MKSILDQSDYQLSFLSKMQSMSLGQIVSDLQRNDSSFCAGCRHKHHVLLLDKTHKFPNLYPRQNCSAYFSFQHNLCHSSIGWNMLLQFGIVLWLTYVIAYYMSYDLRMHVSAT